MIISCRKSKIIFSLLIFHLFSSTVLRATFVDAAEKQTRTTLVKREDLTQKVIIAGNIEANRTTLLTAPYEGYVKKVFVKVGEDVKANDPLISISQTLTNQESVFPIRAPFSGRVTQILVSEGQTVRPSGDRNGFLLRLDDFSKMKVAANIPEIDIVKIHSGLEALIKISAVLDRSYHGVVQEVSQAATATDGFGRSQIQYGVKIDIKDEDTRLRPGMSAVMDLVTEKKENILTLPHEFIQKDDEKYYVTLVKNSTQVPIEVGLQNESAIEIKSGLKEGDEVLQTDFALLVEKSKK